MIERETDPRHGEPVIRRLTPNLDATGVSDHHAAEIVMVPEPVAEAGRRPDAPPHTRALPPQDPPATRMPNRTTLAAAIGGLRVLEQRLPAATAAEASHPGRQMSARPRAAENNVQQDDTLRGWVEWLLTAATAAEAVLSPGHRPPERSRALAGPPPPWATGEDSTAARAWMTTHLPDLTRAVRAAFARQWWDHTWQLADAMHPVLLPDRHHALRVEVYLDRGLPAATAARNRRAERRMLTSGASGLRGIGRCQAALAHYQAALDSARADSDRHDESQALHGIGDIHLVLGEYEQAAELLTQARDLRRDIGCSRDAALSETLLGVAALRTGDHTAAIRTLTRAHTALLDVRDHDAAARALAYCGRAHALAGQHTTALKLLARADEQFAATGSASWRAAIQEWTAQAHAAPGNHSTARPHSTRARDLHQPGSNSAQRLTGTVTPSSPTTGRQP